MVKPASALVMAALAASLMASAAAFLLIETRTARAASGENHRLARAQLEAERALAIAIVRLDAGEALPAQGRLFSVSDAVAVERQDATGLIDVNAAPPARLAALFIELGADVERATALAEAIADWRDADDLVRVNGAERERYEDAGLPPPANRAFITEGEISAVIGMDRALLACALPFLTTYSGQGDIDQAAAPPSLRGLGEAPAPQYAAPGAPLGRVIALRAYSPISRHAYLRRTLWIRLTGDPERPVFIHRAEQALTPQLSVNANCGSPRS